MSRLDVFPLPRTDASGGTVKITSPFGPRDGGVHAGVDLGTTDGIEVGTPVHAPADGRVVRISDDGPFVPPNRHTAGLNLWFQADDGRRWKMFHLHQVLATSGQHVTAGTVIAEVGHSGTQAAHLHLECHDTDRFNHAVDHNADVQEALAAGRFPGTPGLRAAAATTSAAPTPTPLPPRYLETLMIRNDSDGAIYILGTKDGRPAWIHLNPDEAGALMALGVTNLDSVGNGNDARDRAFSVFQR